MPRHRNMKKILIGGTGRAGTSLLSRMFTDLGLRDRIPGENRSNYDEFANAGYEESLEEALEQISDQSTSIIKTPWIYQLCEEEVFNSKVVAFVITPIRGPFVSTVSRCINEVGNLLDRGYVARALGMVNGQYAGSIYYSTSTDQQEALNNQSYTYLAYWCALKNIPLISVPFPSAFEEPRILADLLEPVLRFCSVSRKSLIDWMANNYSKELLAASLDENFEPEIRRYLTDFFLSKRPPDGLVFVKGLEKLIKTYQTEISRLKSEGRVVGKLPRGRSQIIMQLSRWLLSK